MLVKIITIITLLGLFAGSRYLGGADGSAYSQTLIITGVVLISAYLLALLLKGLKLPKLTGYMLLGMLIGPAGLNFLDQHILNELKVLENLALSFIALTAGGEFKYKRIKKYIKAVLALLTGQVAVVFWGLLLLLLVLADAIPFFNDLGNHLIIGFAILFAGTAVSKSPATTIGIITELKSKGKLTDIVLSVTVLKSILLVLAFPLLIMWAKLFLIEGTVFNLALLTTVVLQVAGSVLFGVILGFFIIWYLKTIQIEQSLFLLGIAVIITEFSAMFNVEILLTSIITGIIVENFSKTGEQLIKNIEKSSLPFYIIFFSFAGAGLHLDTLQKAIILTLFLVIVRMGLIYLGNLIGALAVKEDRVIKHLSWMGFIGQAGIAVGLGTIIENTFPGSIGTNFKTILIASVVINELLGPVFLKFILVKTKEYTVKS